MSGIIALTADGSAGSAERVVSAMIDRLRHRGPDGVDVASEPGIALAHLHFWTTPEEVGERQPVSDPESGHVLVFDGRIDNRGDLETALGEPGPAVSDARLLLRAYQRWGRSCFEKLLGPYAVLIWDSRVRTLVAARDPMGDRTLFYASIPGGVAFASEEYALLAHPAVSPDLDEETLARYFAIEAPRAGATFFRAIRELPAGFLLHGSGGDVKLEPFFTPNPPDTIRYRRDEEYAEHLASVLGDAVESRLRSTTQVGVSLSGGMDSPSVAALAAERLARQGTSQRLASFSWVFDELPECDERRWIEPLVAHLGLDATYVVGDSYWPLRDPLTWPLNPSTPLSNPYRTLKQALYAAAAKRGVRTLLTGVFSDRLFVGREFWLVSCLQSGRWREAFRYLAHLVASPETRPVWRDPAIRALILELAPFLRRGFPAKSRPAWLTPAAWDLVVGREPGLTRLPQGARERRTAQVFDQHSRLSPSETFFTSMIPIEVRDPFRDLRVVRLMLAFPPDQLKRGAERKLVLRNAMRSRLPCEVIDRSDLTPLDPFYRKKLFGREAATLPRLLRAPEALWRGYVEEEWLLGKSPEAFQAMPDGRALLVPFFAAAVQLWSPATGGDG